MNTYKTMWLAAIFSLAVFALPGEAYIEDYPPYAFKDGQPPHLHAANLLEDTDQYRSDDGKILAGYKMDEENGANLFSFRVDGRILWERDAPSIAVQALYRADLDQNGWEDYIIISWAGGTGLGGLINNVDILLGKADRKFDRVSFAGMGAGLEDFIDSDRDGRYEVLRMDMYGGSKHNYFVYNIYRIHQGRLINANNRFKGFPKFIWYTYDKNDKDTHHLSRSERARAVKEMNSGIEHQSFTA